MNILFILLYLTLPALILYLCHRFPVLEKVGAVLICYLFGILLGNIGIFPRGFAPIQSLISEATVALALPLLLFSLDVKSWSKIAGKAMLSMLLATVAVVTTAFFLFTVLRNGENEQAWQLAGMSMGVYTGGTPNLASIKTALGVSGSTYILFHTYDTVFSLIYIFFVISVAQRFFNRFLPKFIHEIPGMEREEGENHESLAAFGGMFGRKVWPRLVGALLLSAAVVGGSLFLGGFIPEGYRSAGIILLITSSGIAFSFMRPIRNIEKSFQLGMYIIYVFCLVVASMTDLTRLVTIDVTILLMVFFSIFGSMALHALFCRFFKVDTDTFLVTSVSAICSPPSYRWWRGP